MPTCCGPHSGASAVAGNPYGRICVALLLALGAGAMVLFPITNTDIWWHLASGRWIIEHRAWPRADPFASDTLGRPWIDIHWLFQLLAYLTHRLGGLSGLVVTKSVIVGLGVVVTLRAMLGGLLGRDLRWQALGAAIVLATLFPARYLVLARPIVVTLLLFGVFLLLLERYREGHRVGLLWWLIPIQIGWANVQSLYVLGPLVVACYLLGEGSTYLLARWRFAGFTSSMTPRHLGWLALALIGVCVASVVTPYGWDAGRLPFRLFGRIDSLGSALFSLNVSENIPLWLLEQRGSALSVPFRWVAIAAFGSFLLNYRTLPLARIAVLGAMFALAATAHRNALLLCWVGGPIAAANIATWLDRRRSPKVRPMVSRLAPWVGMAVVLGFLAHRAVIAHEGPIHRPAPFRIPNAAVNRLAGLGLRGPLFNSVRYGGYIAWTLHPEPRPCIDGRLVLRSSSEFAQHLRLLDEPARFDAYRRQQGIELALLPTAFPDRYLALVASLYRDPRWSLLYTDGTQTLFVHQNAWDESAARPPSAIDLDDQQTISRLAGALQDRFGHRPALLTQAVVNLGRLLGEIGLVQRGIELLEPHPHRNAQSLLARLIYLDGQQERARKLARALIARHDDDAACQLLLAQIALERGELAEALNWARRLIRVDPDDREAKQLIAEVERRLGPPPASPP